ncbi:hypothetical protein M23134_05076 [Microscilla marina ATCC 23134]|uniref:Uncharacterized protein n=1 Tax=Microscilla marina ATCC 23134 TaxID=313606 RepID=A1ZD31_MICM2|nr:hypothetical protein M23134_05076 [Microscilla marina ATCC 23134]
MFGKIAQKKLKHVFLSGKKVYLPLSHIFFDEKYLSLITVHIT